MANIELTWDATQTAAATDVDTLEIWSIDGDQTLTYPQVNNQIDAAQAAAFVAAGNLVTGALLKSTDNFTQQNVTNPGTGITWGVFSKNAAGYGPGSIVWFDGF